MLRAIITFSIGVISGIYLEQHYQVPPVSALIPKCKEIFEQLFPPREEK